ncbi:hypothetical protein A2716_04010 [candidate division WWE3 bacterium RIFCSPHIGHO2_01_FULL_40_23]|uniref:Thioredoxin domain-containing protein n=1 Tax=candidate division WWE3 bacterium RIFCSPLOWO2_01_FULL_41_18 TaxID=1802625 RepID=A0A1F4VCR0_UNCKA|nr:MAG: hypothetical protein A2716_04010 [candidate division WWE3 bacterium RIFCSPHIGHO2_01_FULL_40_23]OGC55041.1 MAG: hypothetical protein A3A78_03620 [candidate division WWE3 bacterium RIFCSPLOWO2_01_FULL_41_18]
MKNQKLVISAILLTVILGSILFLTQRNRPAEEAMKQKEESQREENPIGSTVKKDTTSRYIEYKSNSLNENNDKRKVLYFYANWCPICKPADAEFKNNSNGIPEDTVVIRVNYNDSDTDQEEKDLARKYGIAYQHTFVQIDQEGNEVAKWNGGALSKLLENLK